MTYRTAAVLLTLPAVASAQTLAVDNLTAGDTAAFDVAGAVPGDLAVFALGFSGVGPGLCLDGSTCLDLIGLPTVLATASVDGGGAANLTLPLSTGVPAVPVAAQVVLVGVEDPDTGQPTFSASIGASDAANAYFDRSLPDAVPTTGLVAAPVVISSSGAMMPSHCINTN